MPDTEIDDGSFTFSTPQRDKQSRQPSDHDKLEKLSQLIDKELNSSTNESIDSQDETTAKILDLRPSDSEEE